MDADQVTEEKKIQPLQLEAALFSQHLLEERRLSPNTHRNYLQAIEAFRTLAFTR